MSSTPSTPSPLPFENPAPVELATWRAAVEAGLEGTPFDKKYARPVAPDVPGHVLSTQVDARDPGLPGHAPFLRGTRAGAGWETALPTFLGAVGSIEALADDAAHGATAAFLLPSGSPSSEPAQLLLAEVPDSLGVYLVPGVLTPQAVALAARDTVHPMLSLGLDPVCTAAMAGSSANAPGPWEAAGAALAAAEDSGNPALRPLCIDSGWAHGAGADDVLDLAILVASGVAQLKRLMDSGHSLQEVSARQVFHVNLGPAFFQGIAKLRALRALWARVCEAAGDVDAAGLQHVVAGLGARHLTVRDPHVNMLRNTAACFAGAAGGADVVLSMPFDLFLPSEGPGATDAETRSMARRVARNTPLMLALESGLDAVQDPMGGSWTQERLTAELAAAAWARFQAIEAEGGIENALADGLLKAQVDAAWTELSAAVDKRKAPLTGVSEFALLDEPLSGPSPAVPRNAPFPLRRLSAGFERLRDRADAHLAAGGRRPAVFLANLGPIAEHTGRATWITNVLAAGGIEALGNDGFLSSEEVAQAFERSGATHACICGQDSTYATLVEEVATALEDAGAEGLLLAGRPGEQETAWSEAGISQFVYLGVDLRSLLSGLLTELIAADPPPGDPEGEPDSDPVAAPTAGGVA